MPSWPRVHVPAGLCVLLELKVVHGRLCEGLTAVLRHDQVQAPAAAAAGAGAAAAAGAGAGAAAAAGAAVL